MDKSCEKSSSFFAARLHWQDFSNSQQQPQWLAVDTTSRQEYHIIPSDLDELLLGHLQTQDIVLTNWKITNRLNHFVIYLKINSQIFFENHKFIVELHCQLPDDCFAQQIKFLSSTLRSFESDTDSEFNISPIDSFKSLLQLLKLHFLDFLLIISSKKPHSQHFDIPLDFSTQVKQLQITYQLLETLYSKQSLTLSSQTYEQTIKKSEFSRVASLLPLAESILSGLPEVSSVEINCFDTSDNTLLYQTHHRVTADPNGTATYTPSSRSDPDNFDHEPKFTNLYLSNVSELTPITNLTYSRNNSSLNFLGTPIPLPHSTIPAPLLPPSHPHPISMTLPTINQIKLLSSNPEGDEGAMRIESLAQHSQNSTESPKSLTSQSPQSLRTHSTPIKFQVYEIQGTITFISSTPLKPDLFLQLTILVRVIGRRIYELYRGKRNKKLLANLQREYESLRCAIIRMSSHFVSQSMEQKSLEVSSLRSTYSQLQHDMQGLELVNERLEMMVQKEEHLRDANLELKHELEKHYHVLLEDCKR
jgi:hypothetical protein